MAICKVCFRHCSLEEGQMGFCMGRICEHGEIISLNYGLLTAAALDPIEKKPLRRFHPGSTILSVGSFGCNLRCPFCQNSSISWSQEAAGMAEGARSGRLEATSPEHLTRLAVSCRDRGSIGVAYTYNEPLIGYEFVRDTAALVHREGMKNVLVTNGTASAEVLEELAPYIDAMNIDLKGFTDEYYEKVLGGNRRAVMEFIRQAVTFARVELTTLIIPGENDTDEEMHSMCQWIASLRDGSGKTVGSTIPLHISRFFPQFHMTDRGATDTALIYHLADIAREHLEHVYTGNC